MLMYLLGAILFAMLTLIVAKRAKDDTKIYAKLAAVALLFITTWFVVMFLHFWVIGESINDYYNSGSGITYNYTSNNTTITQTFYNTNDTRVGEYLALQKSDDDIITIFSNIFPILAILLGGYLLWYYTEEGLYARDSDRVT